MNPKMIVFLMFAILGSLMILSKYFRKHEKKVATFERFFFEKISEEKGSLEKVKEEVVAFGKKLGLSDQKIESLIQENSL